MSNTNTNTYTNLFYVVTEPGLTDLKNKQVLTRDDLESAIATYGPHQFVAVRQNPYSLINTNFVIVTEDNEFAMCDDIDTTTTFAQAYAYARNYYDNQSIGSEIVFRFNDYTFVL